MPETVEIVTVSPLFTVMSGFRAASKKPQCTVSGPASIRWFAIVDPLTPAPLPANQVPQNVWHTRSCG
jgi:hypothetical protein